MRRLTERIVGVRLDDETLAALEELARGRSKSAAIREAILLAARLAPVLQRLDRIESLLAGGAFQPTPMPPNAADPAAEATRAAVLAFAADDD